MNRLPKRMQSALTAFVAGLALWALMPLVNVAHAESAKVIDTKVDETIARFDRQIQGGREFLRSAKGVLVFPSVVKAGIGVGGEYGEGALRVNGKTVAYYNTAGASFGLQLGVQAKSIILVFMQEQALKNFRNSQGWKVGVDGSVALVKVGAGGSLDTANIKDPIVGFVFGQKGLMYNLTLEGSKFTKLNKSRD